MDVLAIEPSGRPVVIEVSCATTLSRGGRWWPPRRGAGAVQTEVPDATAFHATLDAALADGAMRVVLVLDRAPPDLIRLVGFLEAVTHGLVIDLVTVASTSWTGGGSSCRSGWSRSGSDER